MSAPDSPYTAALASLSKLLALGDRVQASSSPDEDDMIQRAIYELHANDLQAASLEKHWLRKLRRAASFPIQIFTTAREMAFSVVADPLASARNPVGFFYAVFAYFGIFMGLSIFQVFLICVTLYRRMRKLLGHSGHPNNPTRIQTIVNSGPAGERMFKEDGPKVVRLASKYLGIGYRAFSPNDDKLEDLKREICGKHEQTFNIGIARALLLFSAAVYERGNVRKLIGKPNSGLGLIDSEHVIREFAKLSGIEFCSISDCVSVGSAYAGAFYYKGKNPWICVVFKGTDPFEMSEWVIDASLTQENAEDYLWGDCHEGFYNTLFPAKGSKVPVLPYKRIIDTVKMIARKLSPEGKVQVWVAGHSLGAGLATLFYARTLKYLPSEFQLRQCYTFGCPGVGNAHFLAGLEELLHRPEHSQHVIWRVSNANDVVTMVPPGVAGNRCKRTHIESCSLLDYGMHGINLHLERGSIVVGRTDPGTVIKLQQIQERVGAGGSKKAEAFEVSIQKLSFTDSIKGSVYSLLSAIIWPGPVSFLLDHRTISYWKSLEALNSLERLDSDSYKSTGTATASTSTSLTSSPAISPSTSQTGSETTRVDGELLEP